MGDDARWVIGLDPTTKMPDPVATPQTAARPRSLNGAAVGLISNGKGRATMFLEAIYDELATMANLAGKILVQKATVFAIPDPGDWSRITAGATVGITGFGG
jgi:hypothetical protein